jgi:C4-dicarboxylate transporter DctQ subunit
VRYLTRAMEIGLVAIFATFLAVVVGQVVLRYFRIDVLYFSEELVRYLLVWSVLIGATVVTARNAHVRVDILDNALPPLAKRWLDVAGTLVLLAFAAVLCWSGLELALRTSGMRAPMLGIPMWVIYAALPLSGLLDFAFLLARLAQLLRGEPPEILPPEGEQIDTSL